MGKPLVIKRRLPDGSFGDPVKPFGGESDSEKVARLESENANITFTLLEKDTKIEELEASQAMLLFQLLEKGVF